MASVYLCGIVVSVDDYLSGHMLQRMFALFETVVQLEPWCKDKLMCYFPETPEDEKLAEKLATEAENREERLRSLNSDLKSTSQLLSVLKDTLQSLHVTNPERESVGEKTKSLADKIDDIKKTCKLIEKENAQAPVYEPRWIRESRKVLGRRMKQFAGGRWDMYMCVSVVRAFLPDIFASCLLGYSENGTRELLDSILRIVNARDLRAHREVLDQSDVVEAIRQAAEMFRLCAFEEEGQMRTLQQEAMHLVDKCNKSHDDLCAGPVQSAEVCNSLHFFRAITSWEQHVEKEVGKSLEYTKGTISFGVQLVDDHLWENAVKCLKPHFKTIAFARHWFSTTFRNPSTSKKCIMRWKW